MGTLSQSRMRLGLLWYMSVMMLKVCQQSIFSRSGAESRMMRMAKRSYTPSTPTFCFFIFCQMLCMLFVRPFMWNFRPTAFSFSSMGCMKRAM